MAFGPLNIRPLLAAVVVAGTVAIIASPAYAESFANVNESVINVPNAPVAITHCRTGDFWGRQFVNVANRTKRRLLSLSVQFRFYDSDGTAIGQTTEDFRLADSPLASGDTSLLETRFYINLSEPESTIGRATCRIQSASFTGLKKWTFGQRWPEALLPLPRSESNPTESQGGSQSNAMNATPRIPAMKTPRVSLSVTNAWNDTVNGNLFVHVALTAQGSDNDATLQPEMIGLTMALANGGKKTYIAMTEPAPTYEKMSPLGGTSTTAYEVDPKEDFGRLGPVIVPAHGATHVVATFRVGSDVVANPNDNRTVALR